MNAAQPTGLHVLLAEDDEISALYFADALRAAGCTVCICSDGRSALAQARTQRCDLLLLDLNLPHLDGVGVLMALRADASAANHTTPAIATCAGLGNTQCARLLAAGFADALPKPLPLARLHASLQACRDGVVLDEARARAVTGDAGTLAALRGMLVNELAHCAVQLDQLLEHDRDALCGLLHKLRAGCGFCGADQLEAASAALHAELHAGRCETATLARFRALLGSTRISLLRAGARVPAAPAAPATRH